MKKFSGFLYLALFLLLLVHPHLSYSGASSGLLLWYQVILPTLFPYALLVSILIETNSLRYLTRFLAPLCRRIFRTSDAGSFVVVTGYLCGYPMGAKAVNDMVIHQYLSKKEGQYLLSFCNNASPSFLINYVLIAHVTGTKKMIAALVILYLSTYLVSLVTRRFHARLENVDALSKKTPDTVYRPLESIDTCIINSFETMVKVGGYIMLFSILLEIAEFYLSATAAVYVLPFFELTNGIQAVETLPLGKDWSYILMLALTSFGGICQLFQTKSMIKESGLQIFPYTLEKLATAIVTSLLAILSLHFF
ncbi:MAG: transporter [Hespellia sp.]|nr:transporter [Hespellia sp.]